MALTEFLTEVMKRRNIPVYELAVMAKVNEFLLNKMLRGEHKFTHSMLERVALVLNIRHTTIAAVRLLDEVEHDTLREAIKMLDNPNWFLYEVCTIPERIPEEKPAKSPQRISTEIESVLRKTGDRKAYHRAGRNGRHRLITR